MNKNLRILVLSLLAGFAANAKLDAESYQWTGPASGNWNDANNWTPKQVPGSGDLAYIPGGFAVVIDSTISINDLYFDGGSSLTVTSAGILNLLNDVAIRGSLVNAGIVNWGGGNIISANLYGYTGAINNQAGGLFDIRCDGILQDHYGAGVRFVNAGTLRKSAGTGTTTIGVVFDNSGTVQAQSGTLTFSVGGTAGGYFQAADGAALYLSGGTFAIPSPLNFQGPGMAGINGAVALTGTLSGALNCYGGSLTGNTSLTVANDGVLSVRGNTDIFGYLHNTGIVEAQGGTLNLRGGAWSGILAGPLNWYSGEVRNGTTLTVASTGILNVLGDVAIWGSLVNDGAVNWVSGNIGTAHLYGYTGAINNRAGGLLDIRCDGILQDAYGAYVRFVNAGTLRKRASTGTTTIGVVFDNSGTVEAQSGTLSFLYACTGVSVTVPLAGALAATDYGRIVFAQPPGFSGPFTLTLTNGFVPVPGHTFEILKYPSATGDFTSFEGLDLGNGLHLEPRFGQGSMSLVATMHPLEATPKLNMLRTLSGIFIWWTKESTNWELRRSIDLKAWVPAAVSGTSSKVVPAVLPHEFFRLQERP